MEYIYALSIRGKTLYFSGNIPDSRLSIIDDIAKKIEIDKFDTEYRKYGSKFTEAVLNELKIELKQINICYVFRK